MNKARITELIGSLKACSGEKYHKDEAINEMLTLQNEMACLAFNSEGDSMRNVRIWDVVKHFENLNESCGHAADVPVQKFKDDSKEFCNLIKAAFSGKRGEEKAFHALEHLYLENIILKNIELARGDFRTELDAVVITPKAISIVEVKNTHKNIDIDSEGNYFLTGEYLRRDCNIMQKMQTKENLLRDSLTACEINEIPIQRIVVFTDNRIEVHNELKGITTCFLGNLAHTIESFGSDANLSADDMEMLANRIELARCREAYPLDFDARQFKEDFATLYVAIEEAMVGTVPDTGDTQMSENPPAEQQVKMAETINPQKMSKLNKLHRWTWSIAQTAAAIGISLIATTLAVSIIGGD